MFEKYSESFPQNRVQTEIEKRMAAMINFQFLSTAPLSSLVIHNVVGHFPVCFPLIQVVLCLQEKLTSRIWIHR